MSRRDRGDPRLQCICSPRIREHRARSPTRRLSPQPMQFVPTARPAPPLRPRKPNWARPHWFGCGGLAMLHLFPDRRFDRRRLRAGAVVVLVVGGMALTVLSSPIRSSCAPSTRRLGDAGTLALSSVVSLTTGCLASAGASRWAASSGGLSDMQAVAPCRSRLLLPASLGRLLPVGDLAARLLGCGPLLARLGHGCRVAASNR